MIRNKNQADKVVDEIKDEIDRLHDFVSPKRRRDAALELMDYLRRHHVDYL